MMAKKQEFTYEVARKRLEQILREIDSGKIGIDDLEKTLEEAKELIDQSLKKLEQAEKIILKWEK
ncbi:MAG: exodeoxyribonuclease VII small subunit [Bacteroidetes bacterium]|nr:exodeoxyribonuclease VII small subunit [Bacteroidota bacterium]